MPLKRRKYERAKPKAKSKAKPKPKAKQKPKSSRSKLTNFSEEIDDDDHDYVEDLPKFEEDSTESWMEVKQEDPEVKGENGQVPDHEKDEPKEEDLENVNDDELRPIVEDQLPCKVCG